jgi:hypothetical protein
MQRAACTLQRAVAHLSRRDAPGGMVVCRTQAVGHAVMWTSTVHQRSTSEVREQSGISVFVIPAGNCRSDRVPCHSVEPGAAFRLPREKKLRRFVRAAVAGTTVPGAWRQVRPSSARAQRHESSFRRPSSTPHWLSAPDAPARGAGNSMSSSLPAAPLARAWVTVRACLSHNLSASQSSGASSSDGW